MDSGEENQDVVCSASNKDFCMITLADGVSTCSKAKEGASLAAATITDFVMKKSDWFLEYDNQQVADFAVSHIVYELRKRAEAAAEKIEEYSSTVAWALLDKKKNRLLCFNLGDGAILGIEEGGCELLSAPMDSSQGCCVTTTTFADRAAAVKKMDAHRLKAVVICSDGAWHQMSQKDRIKPEVEQMLTEEAYDRLQTFLTNQHCFDDYSFISLQC